MMSDDRWISTDILQKLIRKDPLCDAYRADWSFADMHHLVTMDRALVSVNHTEGIAVSRLVVRAWTRDPLRIEKFSIEVPDADWRKMTRNAQ